MKKPVRNHLVFLCALTLAMPLVAQSSGPFLTTEKSTADPLDIALSYIHQMPNKSAMTGDDLAEMKLQDRFSSKNNGVTHLYFKQQLNGLDVANGQLSVNVHRDGRIINMKNDFVTDLKTMANARAPELTAVEAIRAAADKLGLEIPGLLVPTKSLGGPAQEVHFSGAGLSLDKIPVKLVYYRLEDGSARLAWDMVIRTIDRKRHTNFFVDAVTADVLGHVDWQHSDQYEVFALPKASPDDGPRTIEVNPADSVASPFGWHDTNGVAGAEFTTTRGNNVCAQQDRDDNNSACGSVAQPDGGGALDFTGALVNLDLATQQPGQYQNAAVVNLFYWNNIMHDLLYQYGFDEASGNFQVNNYGRGGLDGDPVNADAQDGADLVPPSTNNATMGTPPEPNGPFSTSPNMSMFEWTPPNINEVVVDSGTAAGSYGASSADFGPALNVTGVSSTIVEAFDGTGTTTDACEAVTNGGTVSGNIALVDRGSCSFVTKVRNAQNAGAVGVLIANNAPGNPGGLGDDGTGGDITIPSVMVSMSDGATIRAGLSAPGTMRANPNPPPNRDSDLDAGIIAHEYCHGLSTRLTGGAGTNCLGGNEQAGEGWSDLCTLFFTAKASDTDTTLRGVGAWSIYETAPGAGIRVFPYTTDLAQNPLTYGDIVTAGQAGGLSIPHGVGTVWATAVWDMYWNLTNDQGFDADLYNGSGGNNVAIQLVVDGLKLQGCNPTFVDARDAILAADAANNGGANECLIWSAFAKRGLGVSANDGGSSTSLNVTEAFDLPAQCVVGCGNGICEAGEDCNTCASDCPGGSSSGAVCGNGVCEAGNGEDCVSCAADCNGVQSGKPSNRFCCGDGDGTNPISCSDSRCTSSGFDCTDVPVSGGSFCCGDLVCDAGESCSSCALDCTIGAEVCVGGLDDDCDGDIDCADSDCSGDPNCSCIVTENPESSCSDGTDNDCDGLIDSNDPDCQVCTLGQRNDSCSTGADCCSGLCKNNGRCR